MKADLHMHTTASDGILSPVRLVEMAKSYGVELMAITDHDTFEGVQSLMKETTDIPVIQGVELSLRDMHGLHLLGYGVRRDTPLHRKVKELAEQRVGRAGKMLEKLAALGVELSMEELTEKAGGTVGRMHIARAMAEAGYVTSLQEAFDRYIGDDGPAYVSGERLNMAEALPLMAESGFVPVLAHPMELNVTGTALVSLVEKWQGLGLMGLEAYHPSAGRNAALLDKMARRMGLLVTGGSDFHGDDGRHGLPGSMAREWMTAAEDVNALCRRIDQCGKEQ